jgi:hypothetical protein
LALINRSTWMLSTTTSRVGVFIGEVVLGGFNCPLQVLVYVCAGDKFGDGMLDWLRVSVCVLAPQSVLMHACIWVEQGWAGWVQNQPAKVKNW